MTDNLSGNIETGEPIDPQVKKGIMSMQLSNVQVREWFTKTRESVRPWGEFINTSKFKLPKALVPAGKRILKNVEKFQGNYLFVFLGLVVFCILTSPLLLIAIAACLGACYIINLKNQEQKLTIMGRELTLAQQYAGVGVLSFPLFWITGAGAAVFWIIGASMVAIGLHASTYIVEEEAEPFEEVKVETV